MNSSPIGAYTDGNSLMHRLNPFIKLLSLLVLLSAIILSDSLLGYALIVTVLLILILLSGIGFKTALGSIARLWLFYLLILLMNALFFDSESPLWSFWIFNFSLKGLWQGISVVFRVALAIILSNILISSTSPLEIISAIECLIYPLKFIGVPIKDVAMILGISLQFVPTFIEETDMIRKAQTARGARFESKKLREKAGAVFPLVIPIFLSAFRRADELSLAMEARGYRRVKKKVRFPKQNIMPIDIAVLALSCLVCITEYFI